MSKKILITGTSGFLGGALGQHLRNLGHHVTGISRRKSREESVDLHITHDLANALPDNLGKFDVLFHAAALASPWASPKDFHRNIEQASQNIVDYVKKNNIPRLINISSTSVYYIMADQYDISEETPLPKKSINQYAESKLAAENLILKNFSDALSIRPRAIYGPGDTVLLPRLLRAAKNGMLPKIIRKDGLSPHSDLIYIGNLVNILADAIDKNINGVINVTDNNTVNTDELLSDIFKKLKYPKPRFSLSVNTAMQVAKVAEFLSKTLAEWKEPAITQFGVSALVHSKTFNVDKMLSIFGAPKYTTAQGVEAFIKWHENDNIICYNYVNDGRGGEI